MRVGEQQFAVTLMLFAAYESRLLAFEIGEQLALLFEPRLQMRLARLPQRIERAPRRQQTEIGICCCVDVGKDRSVLRVQMLQRDRRQCDTQRFVARGFA
jgi:hypothetical protein